MPKKKQLRIPVPGGDTVPWQDIVIMEPDELRQIITYLAQGVADVAERLKLKGNPYAPELRNATSRMIELDIEIGELRTNNKLLINQAKDAAHNLHSINRQYCANIEKTEAATKAIERKYKKKTKALEAEVAKLKEQIQNIHGLKNPLQPTRFLPRIT